MTPKKHIVRLSGGVQLELGARTLIMGILNATPDSFSDGGRYDTVQAAVERAKQMVAEGADILDIGGESTRPGYVPVPEEEEIRRVVPVIHAIRQALPHIPLSIDTYKPETARQSLAAGAHIINDIWALRHDPRMAVAAAEFECPVILNHNRPDRNYTNFVGDVIADLQESIRIAHAAGVRDDRIWLDPGIGFAKDYDENIAMMGRLTDLAELGYPVLLGTSRKGFIGQALGGVPSHERVEGTAATVSIGIMQGCGIVRVHDVQAMKRVSLMTDAIVYRDRGKG
ncbi:dihydropteroate synthase [Paenibacillus curdlanolyticus YK9]|uniref:Dihydropteroate synthase n=1 Tax=Paenibacillus curdlanolyticus YK9 TaxID=717606 RepID=E0I8X5_9BACL|nr:dihydropteroate synthase [Paenibacillus curdlanolyticus]EFM10859.1 dihydropteroate synthase [Paenibacillus curdlanolyticus YK9]